MSATKQVIKAQATAPRKRRIVETKEFIRWGEDDNRPQELLDLVAASGTASVCTATKAKFIEGNGLKDLTLYKAVINERGQTVDQLLKLLTDRQSKLAGYGKLVNINLLGNPCSVYFIPTEHLRLGQPDEFDTVNHLFVKRPKPPGAKGKEPKPTPHLVFDPLEPAADRAERVANWPGGVAAYPGEIYYDFGAAVGYYPEPVYTSVEVDMESEAGLKRSRRTDIDSGYSAQTMITEYGDANPSEERQAADREKYGQFVGAEGGRVLQQYAASKEMKPDVDTLQAPDASKRYQTDGETLKADIRAVFQIPTLLYGEATAGKLGTSQEMDDATKYVQNMVVNTDQRAIERGMEAVFRTFQYPDGSQPFLNLKDFSIQNLSLTPQADVVIPSETEKVLQALNTLSPLVANKVLDAMNADEIRSLIGLKAGGAPQPAPDNGNTAA